MILTTDLLKRCRERCNLLLTHNQLDLSAELVPFSYAVAAIIAAHPGRVPCPASPFDLSPPDSYIDLVATHYLVQGPRISRLLAGSEADWTDLICFIEQRIRSRIGHLTPAGYAIFLDQFEEISQLCSASTWVSLRRFPYDIELEAWVTRVIQFEMTKVRRLVLRDQRIISLSMPLYLNQPDSPTFEDMLPDERAERAYELVEQHLLISSCLVDLTPDQKQLLMRLLRGDRAKEIARDLRRSPNAIYKLHERMVRVMQQKLVGD